MELLMNEQEQKQQITIFFRGIPEATIFEDIIGYQLGSGFIGVSKRDGTLYIYPADRVEEVIYKQE